MFGSGVGYLAFELVLKCGGIFYITIIYYIIHTLLYYILYYLILLYILLYYTILFLLSFLYLPSQQSDLFLLFPIFPSHSQYSFYTCRYLHLLIYIIPDSFPLLFLSSNILSSIPSPPSSHPSLLPNPSQYPLPSQPPNLISFYL